MTWAIAAALENPKARFIAIEAVPENVRQIIGNVFLNDLVERVFVEHAAASDEDGTEIVEYGYIAADGYDVDFVRHNRFIGNVGRASPHSGVKVDVPARSLASLLDEYQEPITYMKIDCEGGEWRFLSDPDANEEVGIIRGEYHDRPWPAIRDLLGDTHEVEWLEGNHSQDAGVGDFIARPK